MYQFIIVKTGLKCMFHPEIYYLVGVLFYYVIVGEQINKFQDPLVFYALYFLSFINFHPLTCILFIIRITWRYRDYCFLILQVNIPRQTAYIKIIYFLVRFYRVVDKLLVQSILGLFNNCYL